MNMQGTVELHIGWRFWRINLTKYNMYELHKYFQTSVH